MRLCLGCRGIQVTIDHLGSKARKNGARDIGLEPEGHEADPKLGMIQKQSDENA